MIPQGWIECVGVADRSCFDLHQHTNATSSKLVAEKRLNKPRVEEVLVLKANKASIGKKLTCTIIFLLWQNQVFFLFCQSKK